MANEKPSVTITNILQVRNYEDKVSHQFYVLRYLAIMKEEEEMEEGVEEEVEEEEEEK